MRVQVKNSAHRFADFETFITQKLHRDVLFCFRTEKLFSLKLTARKSAVGRDEASRSESEI